MPWSETTTMDQKALFIRDWIGHQLTVSELCELYGISRKTGYKWAERFATQGPDGLLDRDHAPRTSPHRTPAAIEDALLGIRLKHPRWGAKKLLAIAAVRWPELALPNRSTVCEILRRNGLVLPRSKRRPIGHPGRPSVEVKGPNDCWSADFKGQFRTGDSLYCYPLTITDNYSRFLLACQALSGPLLSPTQAVFTRVFKEYGLPQRLRTDNGAPFAAYTLGRLSRLSVWLIKLGIVPELIEPGRPQQNGRHERMHKTLKDETTHPPGANLRAQQRKFNAFVHEFNHERPHEALDMRTPSELHRASPRQMPDKLLTPEYPDRFEVRYVSANGGIRWQSQWVNVTGALIGEYVGLEEVGDGLWDVYFGPKKIGRLHERLMRIEDCYGRTSRHV
jgi:transposase InsO family protein